MCGVAAVAISALAGVAHADEKREFNIAPQPLATALMEFGAQSGVAVVVPGELTAMKTTRGVTASVEPEVALRTMLAGTGLTYRREGELFAIVQPGDAATGPQAGSAAGGGAEVEALIVTAQKREEDIQDVPIAMSAFTQEDLTRSQIAGGPDLMTQVPNLTFTKTNFSSYSIQIRGIGTQAISATVDPAVAVAFNNTPFIRNRFFEQEFYDLQRVEVLRGPQGTLFGRNATAGVVNLITARPTHRFEAKLSADVANYSSTRLEGMVNLPLIEDAVALRLAGAWTKRQGFVTNGITGEQIDGRDLWSVRATLGLEPTDAIRAFLTYEHFEENDDRLRSGKQLCKTDPSPTHFGTADLEEIGDTFGGGAFGIKSYTSQGCEMVSLYSPEAFQVPNGFALPYFGPLANIGLPINSNVDPYVSTSQSQDLRVIDSTLTPVYKAKSDLVHMALEFDLTEGLTLTSETGYNDDELFSFQDFNRFNTSSGIFRTTGNGDRYVEAKVFSPEGVFCDPQLGCADRLVGADVSTARSTQFSQEFRLSSNFDGRFNFHVGANFLRHDTVDKYYVFFNSLTAYVILGADGTDLLPPDVTYVPNVSDNSGCLNSFQTVNPESPTPLGCIYYDPNPISSLNDNGRNYFLSKNPFRLISYAAFGEAQYKLTPDLKVTAGLRFTVDKKHAPMIPTWILTTGYGLPVKNIIDQEWREPTGRLVVDWQPALDFTDETLVYASYAHGYKAGGTNPPLPGSLPLATAYDSDGSAIRLIEALQPPEFGPEFVDAFELGTKNTLLDGRLTLNGSAFYYDYEGYQISQIVNRSAINLNFDAEVWGAELEADWRPLDNLRIGVRAGYEKTKIGDGQSAVDMIDRTAGRTDWVVIKPFPTNPSNCVLPVSLLEFILPIEPKFFSNEKPCTAAYLEGVDPLTHLPYVPDPQLIYGVNGGAPRPLPAKWAGYAGFDPSTAPNGGWGFSKDLGGNELPNAPDFTLTISADYTIPLPNAWLVTLHGDYYRQSEAWARIFNEDPYDKLEPFQQVNLAAIFVNEDAGWNIMAYVKNALDADNITGAFLNSDDTGLTTNVFLNEPRLYGLRVTKQWSGDPWWIGGAGDKEPRAFTLELGGSALGFGAKNEVYAPGFVDAFLAPDGSAEGPVPVLPVDVQDEDLDWGDGRDVRLIYQRPGKAWSVSAAARFGRANGVARAENQTLAPGGWLGPVNFQSPQICGETCFRTGPSRYAIAQTRDREDFTILDFTVGRDISLGEGQSRLNGGLRYASFDSETDVRLYGSPDYSGPLANRVSSKTAFLTVYEGALESRRQFEGVGPMLSWEGFQPLLGNSDVGRLGIDWSLSGGVLFGKQEAEVEHHELGDFYSGFALGFKGGVESPKFRGAPTTVVDDSVSQTRSDRVSVPLAGVSLGLSYKIDRVSVGTGYSWERYFDALDGGVDEINRVDRTIDGPYFKFAIGFGG